MTDYKETYRFFMLKRTSDGTPTIYGVYVFVGKRTAIVKSILSTYRSSKLSKGDISILKDSFGPSWKRQIGGVIPQHTAPISGGGDLEEKMRRRSTRLMSKAESIGAFKGNYKPGVYKYVYVDIDPSDMLYKVMIRLRMVSGVRVPMMYLESTDGVPLTHEYRYKRNYVTVERTRRQSKKRVRQINIFVLGNAEVNTVPIDIDFAKTYSDDKLIQNDFTAHSIGNIHDVFMMSVYSLCPRVVENIINMSLGKRVSVYNGVLVKYFPKLTVGGIVNMLSELPLPTSEGDIRPYMTEIDLNMHEMYNIKMEDQSSYLITLMHKYAVINPKGFNGTLDSESKINRSKNTLTKMTFSYKSTSNKTLFNTRTLFEHFKTDDKIIALKMMIGIKIVTKVHSKYLFLLKTTSSDWFNVNFIADIAIAFTHKNKVYVLNIFENGGMRMYMNNNITNIDGFVTKLNGVIDIINKVHTATTVVRYGKTKILKHVSTDNITWVDGEFQFQYHVINFPKFEEYIKLFALSPYSLFRYDYYENKRRSSQEDKIFIRYMKTTMNQIGDIMDFFTIRNTYYKQNARMKVYIRKVIGVSVIKLMEYYEFEELMNTFQEIIGLYHNFVSNKMSVRDHKFIKGLLTEYTDYFAQSSNRSKPTGVKSLEHNDGERFTYARGYKLKLYSVLSQKKSQPIIIHDDQIDNYMPESVVRLANMSRPGKTDVYACPTKARPYIGFIRKVFDVTGKCSPSCFATLQSTAPSRKAMFAKCVGNVVVSHEADYSSNARYLINDHNKISSNRYGFLPKLLNVLLNDGLPLGSSFISMKKEYWLLEGIPNPYDFISGVSVIIGVKRSEVISKCLTFLKLNPYIFTTLENSKIYGTFGNVKKYTEYITTNTFVKHIFVHDLIMLTYETLNIIVTTDNKSTLTTSSNIHNKYRTSEDMELSMIVYNATHNTYSIVCHWIFGDTQYKFNNKSKKTIAKLYAVDDTSLPIIKKLLRRLKPKSLIVNRYSKITALFLSEGKSCIVYPTLYIVSSGMVSSSYDTIDTDDVEIVSTTWKHIMNVIGDVDKIAYIIIRKGVIVSVILDEYVKLSVKCRESDVPVKIMKGLVNKNKIITNRFSFSRIDTIIKSGKPHEDIVDVILKEYIYNVELYDIFKLELTRVLSSERNKRTRRRLKFSPTERNKQLLTLIQEGVITMEDHSILTTSKGVVEANVQYSFEKTKINKVNAMILSSNISDLKRYIKKLSDGYIRTAKAITPPSVVDTSNVHNICTTAITKSVCEIPTNYCTFAEADGCKLKLTSSLAKKFISRLAHELVDSDRVRFDVLNDQYISIRNESILTKQKYELII